MTWIFSPGHAGVHGNERDIIAGEAVIDNNLTIDPATVIQCVNDQLTDTASRPQWAPYTLSCLKEKGVRSGDGATCNNKGVTRRRQNKLLMETLSLQTLRHTLMMREEQTWGCPAPLADTPTATTSNHKQLFFFNFLFGTRRSLRRWILIQLK